MFKAGVILVSALTLCACSLGPERKPAAQMTEAEFSENFVCPEHMSPTGRDQAILDLMDWAKAHRPTWTMAQTLDFRRQLLVRKQCRLTLDPVRPGL